MVWLFYNRLPWRALERGIKKEHWRPLFHVALVFYLPIWDCPGFPTRLARWRCSRHAKNLPAPAPLCPTDPGRAEETILSPPSLELFPPFSSGPPLPCHGSKSVRPSPTLLPGLHALSFRSWAPTFLGASVCFLSVTARIGKLSLRYLQLWSAGCSYTPSVLLNVVDNCRLASRESFINSEEAAPPT